MGDEAAYTLTRRLLSEGWADPDRHLLPDDLEAIPVGAYLAAIVSKVDVASLNGHDAVRLMQTRARLSSHQEARKLLAMAEGAMSPPGVTPTLRWSGVQSRSSTRPPRSPLR